VASVLGIRSFLGAIRYAELSTIQMLCGTSQWRSVNAIICGIANNDGRDRKNEKRCKSLLRDDALSAVLPSSGGNRIISSDTTRYVRIVL
jgi:hypothetical protein